MSSYLWDSTLVRGAGFRRGFHGDTIPDALRSSPRRGTRTTMPRSMLSCAVLVIVVLLTLWVAEVRPRMEERAVVGPAGVVPFYAALGDHGLLLFNLLQLTALDVLVFLLARRAASDAVAFAVALWFALGSLLRPVALNVAPDVLSTLVVLGAVLALLSRHTVLAGALLGVSVWAKWTNLFFLGPALVYALFLGRRAAMQLAAAAVPP